MTGAARLKLSQAIKEKWLNKEYREKTIAAIRRMDRAGRNNPMYHKTHSAEAREKISRAQQGRHPSIELREKWSRARTGSGNAMFGRKHLTESIAKMQKKARERWNDPIYIAKQKAYRKSAEYLEKLRHHAKEQFSDPERKAFNVRRAMQARSIRPTSLEIRVENFLQSRNSNFEYCGDGRFFVSCFNPDFVDRDAKKLIEAYGDYWHSLPGVPEKDQKRLEAFSKEGYRTLVIWEHELENLESLSKKLEIFEGKRS